MALAFQGDRRRINNWETHRGIVLCQLLLGILIDDLRMRNNVSHIFKAFFFFFTFLLAFFACSHTTIPTYTHTYIIQVAVCASLCAYLSHSNRSFCIYVLFNGVLITLNNSFEIIHIYVSAAQSALTAKPIYLSEINLSSSFHFLIF